VLGSIHELNGVFFSHPDDAPELFKDRDLVSVYCEYFEAATEAVRSGLFDIMAHPDLIKKYTHVLTDPLPFAAYRETVEPYVDALLDTGVGMEVNTKGLRLPANEAYPSTEMLELYISKARALGVEPLLTLGSDAHEASEVGSGLAEAAAILRSLGVSRLARFDARQKSAWEL
jgi:histidinol-phosphatase (PHP family)